MDWIIVSSVSWHALIADVSTIKADIKAIKEMIELIGHLTPDQQAKLNKVFDTATGGSAKIDDAISP